MRFDAVALGFWGEVFGCFIFFVFLQTYYIMKNTVNYRHKILQDDEKVVFNGAGGSHGLSGFDGLRK